MNQGLEFISQRDSLASSFASEANSQPYLLSSRHHFTQDVSQSNDLEEFKDEIQFKFIRSVANKIYTFPTTGEAFDMFSDEEDFHDLRLADQYNLYNQNKVPEKQVKMKKKEIKSESANLLLETLKSESQRLDNLKNFVRQNFLSKRKSKSKLHTMVRDPIEKAYGIIHEQPQDLYKKKRMVTEPNEKPKGLIIKRN